MDLTNLTLDELLAQIKSDSGYQEASKELSEPKAKPEPISSSEIIEEDREYIEYSPEPLDFEPIDDPDEDDEIFFAPESEEIPEQEYEEESAEPEPIVYEAPAPIPNEPIEIIEEPAQEAPAFFEPEAVFTPPAPPSYDEPLSILDEDEEEQTVYSPVSVEPQEDEADHFKIFGNINIDADINSFFPSMNSAEEPALASENEEPSEQRAEEKTIVIESFTDKTAVFERPGIITGKNIFEKTADLSAIPAIISADEILKDKFLSDQKTFIRTGAIPIVAARESQQNPLEPDDGQMILPGFGVPEEPPVQVDESAVEDELRKSRSKKVDSFRLEGVAPEEPHIDPETAQELGENIKPKRRRFSATKTRTRLNRQSVEYRKPADKPNVADFIRRKRRSALLGCIISGVCSVVLAVATAVPAVADRINASFSDISVTGIIALALLAVASIACVPNCMSGITCFFSGSGKPNAQTPAALAAVAALIQCVLILIFDPYSEMPVFAAAAALALCLSTLGSWLSFKRIGENFAFLSSLSKDELHTVKTVENAADANKIGKNVVMGEADIRYSGKTKFVSNFLAYSMASDAADDICVRLVPIAAAASALIGVIAGIATKNVLCGISIFAGAMCIGAPASASAAANLPLSRTNKRLRENGGIITGYAGAFEYESTNAIAIDAEDIFPGYCCNIHGMKTFYGVRIDDAILTAASMLTQAGGPISSLFNEVVMGRKELLMNVEDMTYEDRLGLSGWVRGRRVFVGNRKLLEHHNIEIPVSVDEARYRHDGRRVIYLADAGKIAAIFVVSYSADEKIAEQLRKIENNGINLLIRSTDSNITEEFVANAFGLPLNSVKIVSPNAAEVLKAYADEVTPKEDAKIIHSGKSATFLQAIGSASGLCWAAGVITTQQTFCCAAGLILLAGMVLFSSALSVTALQICLCQLVWLGIGAVVPLINKE